MSILIFIVILVVLVVSHEFGHFIVAKLNKIRVDEFSFGFPPKLFGKKIGETQYNFNALPFGGYVKIFGQDLDEDDFKEVGFLDKKETPEQVELSKRSMSKKPRYVQAMVLLAGVAMNFLVAWLLLSIGFMSGLPSSSSAESGGIIVKDQYLTITSVLKDSPAEIGGIKVGDKILNLKTNTNSTKPLSSSLGIEDIQTFIKNNEKKEIDVLLIRGKEEMEIVVVPEKNNNNENATIGISMDMIGTLKLPVHKAVFEGLKLTSSLTIDTTLGFYNLIKGAISGKGDMSSMTGPIGIVGIVGDAAKFGFVYLLSFTAIISINLAVINLIPFPALDGGRLLFLLIEKIKGSRIKPKISNIVNVTGFGLLMILMAVITYHDILKLF